MRACITYSSSKHKHTNENANCVIGIRSNNLLKSCCELRILFGNYVYSSAHPVDVAAASVRWRRSVSASFISSLFPFQFFKGAHLFFFFFWGLFFCSTFVCRTSLLSFDLISYFIFTSLSLRIQISFRVCCAYVRKLWVCWKISVGADCEALKWNMQM